MSNNPEYVCNGNKKTGKLRRRQAKNIAKALGYSPDILDAISYATTESELNRILATGRNRMR